MTAVRSLALWLSRRFGEGGSDFSAWQEARGTHDCADRALAHDVGPRWPEAGTPLAGPAARA